MYISVNGKTRNVSKMYIGINGKSKKVKTLYSSVNGKSKSSKMEHKWGAPTYTWNESCTSCIAKRICVNDTDHIETENGVITSAVKVASTCTSMGTTTYTATFNNAVFITQTKDVVDIAMSGHSYGTPTYTWSEDGSSCVATRVCSRDSSHKETESATITSTVKVAATCENKGTTTYTAKFSNNAFSTQTKDIADIDALGHVYADSPVFTFSSDGKTCTAKYTCTRDASHTKDITCTVTSTVKTVATCTEKGTTTYTATAKNPLTSVTKTSTKDVQDIPVLGHSYGTPTYTWSDDGKTCTAKRVCSHNASHVETESGTVTSAVKIAATCTEKGTTTYTATFTNAAFTTQTKDVVDIDINPSRHNLVAGECTRCDYKTAGLYDIDGNLLAELTKEQCEATYPDSNTLPQTLGVDKTKVASIVFPEGVTIIGDCTFINCSSLTSVDIPNSVTSIGGYAFGGCASLASVTIGNNVTTIGYSAFEECTALALVTIPDSVTSIGNYAFYNCTSLKSLTIPDSVTSIGGYAFSNCTSLTSVTIPDSVKSIGDSAFYNCTSLTSVDIPSSVTSIGYGTFRNCTSLTSVDIPNSVTSIGGYAFRNCTSLTSVTIPDSVTSIGGSAFYNCTSLTSVDIPSSVASIGYGTFYNCTSLTSVTIPNSVTSIGGEVFYGCSSLTSITIPDSVKSIGDSAFYNCTKLTSVTFKTTTGWYVGSSAGAKTSSVSSSNLANKSTAATYLKSTYASKYWTRA